MTTRLCRTWKASNRKPLPGGIRLITVLSQCLQEVCGLQELSSCFTISRAAVFASNTKDVKIVHRSTPKSDKLPRRKFQAPQILLYSYFCSATHIFSSGADPMGISNIHSFTSLQKNCNWNTGNHKLIFHFFSYLYTPWCFLCRKREKHFRHQLPCFRYTFFPLGS